MADVHKGQCAVCGRSMVCQREWRRNPRVRPGRAKHGGLGHCQACYVRGRRQGTLPRMPKVSIIATRYVVRCDQCGLVAEVGQQGEAEDLRVGHRREHGARDRSQPLGELEVARLRRAVGVAS